MTQSVIHPDEKLCGVLIPVFALRREGDLGIGDTTCVKEAIDFCAANKLAVLQVLPINETGGDHSPYTAISSIALDSVLLTVTPDTIPGLDKETCVDLVAKSGLAKLDSSSVHYNVVKRLKEDLLRSGWSNVRTEMLDAGSERGKEFAAFCEKHKSWLDPYSVFRTLTDMHYGDSRWTLWEKEYETPESARKALASHKDAAKIADDQNFRKFVQWLAFDQWLSVRLYADSKNVRLMGDIPFGVSRYSADVWSFRELFDLDWSGGAPPEPFFQADLFTRKWGQNWGIPLYNWEAHEKDDYTWWRQRVGRLTDVFHYFRIDHVLGFFRVYAFPWIPERNGEFLELTEEEAEEILDGVLPQFRPRPDYPEEEGLLNAEDGKILLAMIMDEAGANGVVAEDLGAVPDYVRPLLHDMGIPGFAIPIFERNEEDYSFKDPEELHPLSLVTYATHDHQPVKLYYEDLVARWHGADGHDAWLDVQRLMKFLDRDEENPPTAFTEDLHQSFMKTLLSTPCWLAVNMISDMLATDHQFNAPGTATSSNWSRRLELTLAQYETDPVFGPRIKRLADYIVESGRYSPVAVKSGH